MLYATFQVEEDGANSGLSGSAFSCGSSISSSPHLNSVTAVTQRDAEARLKTSRMPVVIVYPDSQSRRVVLYAVK